MGDQKASPARARRTGDQNDAYSIAARLSRVDQDGSLGTYLKPDLTPPERAVAQTEGWTLGVTREERGRGHSRA